MPSDTDHHEHAGETGHTHARRFQGEPDRLRAPDRLARMEVPRVAALSTEGITVESALDVGTGTGVFAEAFAAQGIAVTHFMWDELGTPVIYPHINTAKIANNTLPATRQSPPSHRRRGRRAHR